MFLEVFRGQRTVANCQFLRSSGYYLKEETVMKTDFPYGRVIKCDVQEV